MDKVLLGMDFFTDCSGNQTTIYIHLKGKQAMNYDPSDEYDSTPDGETNETEDAGKAKQDDSSDTLQDKNAPDELSQPGVGVQYEDEPVGDSD